MDGRDAGRTRQVDEGPTDPGVVWTTGLDGARATGTPAVADGNLYVPSNAVSGTARHRYRLHALSAATGDERWQVPLRSDPNAPAAVRGERIVVSARRSTERGRVVAFRERYGAEEWLHDVDARLTAPPTIDGTTVYVPDWDGRVHALALADGSVRWSRRPARDGRARTFAEPAAVQDGTVYLGSFTGATGVVALDARSGEERWSQSTDVVTAGPVVDDELVVVRTRGPVVAFAPDGSGRWSFSLPGDSWRPMALDAEHVYGPTRERLYAIDRSGERAWTYEPSEGPVGAPTVVGDGVFVRERDRLVGLSRTDGSKRWHANVDGTGRATVTPGGVFLSGTGRAVVALGDQ